MWINLLVIFITIAFGVYFQQSEKIVYVSTKTGEKRKLIISRRKHYVILVSILLILQSGLRNVAVGADTYAYYEAFERVKYMSWAEIFDSFKLYYQLGEGKDPGYLIFQKVIQLVVSNYQVYLILIAVMFFSALGDFVFKNTKQITDVMFAFVLYSTLFYSFFSITGIRQTIATVATLWSFNYIRRNKLFNFVILLLLASTIHKSVLIFIPIYFIRNKKAVKYLLISFAVLLPLVFYYSEIISVFFQGFDDNYGVYEHMKDLKPYNYVILNLVIFFLGVFTYKDSLMQRERDTWFWYAALLIATFFTTQVFQIHGFMRVIYYFSIFNLLLIPHMFQLIAIKQRISHLRLLTLGLLALLSLYIYANYGSEYKFFWQEMALGTNYK